MKNGKERMERIQDIANVLEQSDRRDVVGKEFRKAFPHWNDMDKVHFIHMTDDEIAWMYKHVVAPSQVDHNQAYDRAMGII